MLPKRGAAHCPVQQESAGGEDTTSIAYALCQMLMGMGAEPCTVTSAESALEILRNQQQGPWDLIILDSRLPGMSGLEVLRALRNGETLAHAQTLTIVYTAHSQQRICTDL